MDPVSLLGSERLVGSGVTSEADESTGNQPGLARILGGGQVVLGAIVAVLVFVLPGRLTSFAASCNTAYGDLYAGQHPASGFKCAATTFAVDYKWVFLALAVILIVEGAVLCFREEFKALLRWAERE
jgi:hypothetical protein